MHRSTPRPRPVPGAIVGYVKGRPIRVIAGGSGEGDPAPAPPAPAEPPTPAPASPPAPAPPAPAPTPADVAAGLAAKGAGADTQDVDNVTVTQRRLNALLTREKDQGRQAALRALAADAGLNPDTVDATQLKTVLAEAKALRDAQLSEEQRREAQFTKREQAVAAKEAEAEQTLAAANGKLQEAQRTAALIGLGASGDDLEDALVLLDKALTDTPADDGEAVSTAAQDLKQRRPNLFGATTPPAKPATPPAPSGSPAGGPPQRHTPATKPGDAGRAMAARMFPQDDAA
ncbi:hypothetical protein ABT039_22035 [Streptomyces lasiicapitis]|uniref:hypothetical protein n=1 Tax=Streptomyces lasiicapitis TaxID=1923961 RepID=UPI003325185D